MMCVIVIRFPTSVPKISMFNTFTCCRVDSPKHLYVSEAIHNQPLTSYQPNMSAPQIPNLLASRGGPRSRGGRGRGRGRGGGSAYGTPAQNRKDLDIQSTDTDAAVSRLGAVSLGYLNDPFASYFVNGAGTRRLPIINRGTTFYGQAAIILH